MNEKRQRKLGYYKDRKALDLSRKVTTASSEMYHTIKQVKRGSVSPSPQDDYGTPNATNQAAKDSQADLTKANSTSKFSLSDKAKNATIKLAIKVSIPLVIFLIAASSFVFLLIYSGVIIVNLFDGLGLTSSGIATGGYYDIGCNDVTVILMEKRDNGYSTTGSKTVSLEDYVAGVVVGEVNYLGSSELDKALAVAARTFFANYKNNTGSCTIESSDRYQVFNPGITASAREAAEATRGQVLLKNNQLLSTVQYDAFACIEKDEEQGTYTIAQQKQVFPKDWVEKHITVSDWLICDGTLRNHHGNGMSQYGGLYLAEEKGYDYKQILAYYYGDDIALSTNSYTSSIGLDIKETGDAQYISQRLDTLLNEKGSSIETLNAHIHNNVTANGAGTREGVVTAAVSLINYLYDNYKWRLPYYYGGKYQEYGVKPSFGGQRSPATAYGIVFTVDGFDCSGFVSWAIKNGGYKFGGHSTWDFDNAFGYKSCKITDPSCVGQPGDIINSRACHVQLIVDVDEGSNSYYIAEAASGVVIDKVPMHDNINNCKYYNDTKIIHMDDYYNNSNNVDKNY